MIGNESAEGRALGLGTARVVGESMRPTLRPGDLLLIRYGAAARLGRLAVVNLPGRGPGVKRVTARVPEGWWVERDNPAAGVDSWSIGPIAEADVLAVVVCRIWPPRLRLSGRRLSGRRRPGIG